MNDYFFVLCVGLLIVAIVAFVEGDFWLGLLPLFGAVVIYLLDRSGGTDGAACQFEVAASTIMVVRVDVW